MWYQVPEMIFPDYIDLCSDGETEVKDVKDVRTDFLTNLVQGKESFNITNSQPSLEEHAIRRGFEENGSSNGLPSSSWVTEPGSLYANGFCRVSTLPCSVPLCRQFWKAGDYEAGLPLGPISQNSQNRLRVHPKFLHSNATSHKWAFGAIAELLDNAVDEVQNGATFVSVDKISDPRNGNHALLIQDDGGGMSPESIRHCMSFGFSDKQSDSSIGQYGNGFKTSTMRLGADVIVFSRCMDKRNITQRVGLLSYTFLTQTGCDDIVVPTVDYEFDPSVGVFKKLLRHGQKQFYSNLSTLLRWSPFATEAELLKQFNDIGHHGTKVVVFNLWFSDEGDMELDFDTDVEDIMISGAPKIAQTNNTSKMLIQNHIANRFRYSLRVYSSILYLHLPENFRISLRGRVVEPHRMVNDLKFRECIKYKPQVGGNIEPTVITTIGFLEGSPCLNIHGFNIYHKNRLILPFWPVFSNSNGKCRGVAGVLEVNFLKPTHDRQDFEKSNLYQKLETRLKDMAVEYWDYHCHLVGYPAKKNPPPPARTSSPAHQVPHLGTFNGVQQVMLPSLQLPCSGTPSDIRTVTENPSSFTVNIPGAAFIAGASQTPAGNPPHLLAGRQVVTALSAPTCSTPGQFFTTSSASSQTVPRKRRHENSIDAAESLKKPAVAGEIAAGLGSNQKNQLERGGKGRRIQKLITMVLENKKLQSQCLEFEKVEKQLLLKEQTLRNELQVVQQLYKDLLVELESMDEMKLEK